MLSPMLVIAVHYGRYLFHLISTSLVALLWINFHVESIKFKVASPPFLASRCQQHNFTDYELGPSQQLESCLTFE